MTRLEGIELNCPIYHSHTATIKLNRRGKPYINCSEFGSSFNYNNPAGVLFLENLVGSNLKNNPSKKEKDNDSLFGSDDDEDNDSLFSNDDDKDDDGLFKDW